MTPILELPISGKLRYLSYRYRKKYYFVDTSDVGYDIDLQYHRSLTTISGYFVTYDIVPDMDYDITGMYP